MSGTRYSSHSLMKLEFSRQDFEKYANNMKIRPVGTEFSTWKDGRTDRHNEANSRFSQLSESA